MSRISRQLSESGIYHIMVRGLDKNQLFYDDQDRNVFLKRLIRVKNQSACRIYAWCFMSNHVHLIVDVSMAVNSISNIMQRLLSSYALYFNKRYERVGYVFQDRFKSKAIETDAYFLAAVRYIHRNPLEVHRSVSSWTSFNEYMGKSRHDITYTQRVLQILSPNPVHAKAMFRRLVFGEWGARLPKWSISSRRRISDDKAMEIIKEYGCLRTCQQVCDLNPDARDHILRQCRAHGCSLRQLARLTGINRKLMGKYCLKREPLGTEANGSRNYSTPLGTESRSAVPNGTPTASLALPGSKPLAFDSHSSTIP